MKRRPAHFLSNKLASRRVAGKGGGAVFATAPVAAGELLVVWGGRIVGVEEFARLPARRRRHSIQVEEDLYQVSPGAREDADNINHSCNPNAGLAGPIALVAMVSIEAGEEVCYDYAMSDGSPYDEFECACGGANCRGRVSGKDWQVPGLQQRYRGYFSPYLQRRIDNLAQHLRDHGMALPARAAASIAAT